MHPIDSSSVCRVGKAPAPQCGKLRIKTRSNTIQGSGFSRQGERAREREREGESAREIEREKETGREREREGEREREREHARQKIARIECFGE